MLVKGLFVVSIMLFWVNHVFLNFIHSQRLAVSMLSYWIRTVRIPFNRFIMIVLIKAMCTGTRKIGNQPVSDRVYTFEHGKPDGPLSVTMGIVYYIIFCYSTFQVEFFVSGCLVPCFKAIFPSEVFRRRRLVSSRVSLKLYQVQQILGFLP